MKVLVSDNLGEIGIEMFRAAEGIEVDVKTGLDPEALKAIIGDSDGLVIRGSRSSAGPASAWITWTSWRPPNAG